MVQYIINSPWLSILGMVGCLLVWFYIAVYVVINWKRINGFMLLMWLVFGWLILPLAVFDALIEAFFKLYEIVKQDIIKAEYGKADESF